MTKQEFLEMLKDAFKEGDINVDVSATPSYYDDGIDLQITITIQDETVFQSTTFVYR